MVMTLLLQVEEESDETLTREDVRSLSQAVEALKVAKEGEKATLKELQQDREEYNEVTTILLYLINRATIRMWLIWLKNVKFVMKC